MTAPALSDDKRDALQEMVNIGMGAAGAALAQVLNAFVELTVPSLDFVDPRRMVTMLNLGSWADGELTAVRQPFFGRILGESLMLFHGAEADRLADLVGCAPTTNIGEQHELLLDLANVVIGACVNGIAEPMREVVSFDAPSVLKDRPTVCGVSLGDTGPWQHGLLINIDFKLEAKSFRSRVLVFLSERSLALIESAIAQFLDELTAS